MAHHGSSANWMERTPEQTACTRYNSYLMQAKIESRAKETNHTRFFWPNTLNSAGLLVCRQRDMQMVSRSHMPEHVEAQQAVAVRQQPVA